MKQAALGLGEGLEPGPLVMPGAEDERREALGERLRSEAGPPGRHSKNVPGRWQDGGGEDAPLPMKESFTVSDL